MMNFKVFTEGSYETKDIPKFFYVATNAQKSIGQLLQGKLIGLKGISSNREIGRKIHPVNWNLTIKTDAKKTLAMNKISRLMYYDNPYTIYFTG